MTNPDLFILAGEPSGDFHGKNLLLKLLEKYPGLKVSGVGGPALRSCAFSAILPMEEFQVMGFSDVLRCLPKLISHFHTIRDYILDVKPRAVIFIDYPGFNLRMAESLRNRGFKGKLVHYIAPTVWAHGKKRIPKMAKNLDLLLTVYPFEPAFFKNTSLPALYVGNPIAKAVSTHAHRQGWKQSLQLQSDCLLALFPGSRPKDVERNLKTQLLAAFQIKKDLPQLQVGISSANASLEHLIKKIAQDTPLKGDFRVVPKEFTYELMHGSLAAIAKSGTVTLELALHGCPTVVTYKLSPLNYFIAKYFLKVNLPRYCIANILLEENLFPEEIGINLDSERIASQLKTLIDNPKERFLNAASRLRSLLTEKDGSLNAASEIGQLLS